VFGDINRSIIIIIIIIITTTTIIFIIRKYRVIEKDGRDLKPL
jgi:hypothetical protein